MGIQNSVIMKISQEIVNTKRMKRNLAMEYLREVFPGCTICFDEKCISKIKFSINSCVQPNAEMGYDKLSITSNGLKFYWPIEEYSEEMSSEKAMEFLIKANSKLVE
jgi:hypothetical protein